MATGASDSPASLYGPVALVFGTIALISAGLVEYLNIAIPMLCGSLAVTLAGFGLTYRVNRGQCALGLISGGTAVLYIGFLIVALGV